MKKQLTLALVLALAPFAAFAGDKLSYSYIEGGYAQQNIDGTTTNINGFDVVVHDIEATGFHIGGSAELGEAMYLFGSYGSGTDDVDLEVIGFGTFGDINVDAEQTNIGFGFHHGLSERADLLAEGSYLRTRVEIDTDEGPIDGDGDDYRVAVGFRGALAEHFEGWVKAQYTDGDTYDGSFGGVVGAQVKFNQTWGIVGEAEFADDTSRYMVGVRASF